MIPDNISNRNRFNRNNWSTDPTFLSRSKSNKRYGLFLMIYRSIRVYAEFIFHHYRAREKKDKYETICNKRIPTMKRFLVVCAYTTAIPQLFVFHASDSSTRSKQDQFKVDVFIIRHSIE